jgi:hypothetical protein
MKDKRCWICRRNAQEVIRDSLDKDLEPRFVFTKTGNQWSCLICELVISNTIDGYMKEKFGRDGR